MAELKTYRKKLDLPSLGKHKIASRKINVQLVRYKSAAISKIVPWLGIIVLVLAARNVKAISKYKIERLNTPGSNSILVRRDCINDYGEIVGEVSVIGEPNRVFVYKNGTIRKLEPQGLSIQKMAINDFGDVVVSGIAPGNVKKSYIYKLGEKIELDFQAEDINNKGEVVGEHYLWRNGEKIDLTKDFQLYRDIPPPHQGTDDIITLTIRWDASAINDNNQVVLNLIYEKTTSYRPYPFEFERRIFILENGTLKDLERDINAILDEKVFYGNSCGLNINNKGEVVGWSKVMFYPTDPFTGSIKCACMWDENRKIKIFEDAHGHSEALAINNKGQTVGYIRGWRNETAILYQNEEKSNLNDFLPENSEFAFLYEAMDINNKGQIVGNGYIRYVDTATYAFLMTPIALEGDLNSDTIVNLEDLSILAEHWLEGSLTSSSK